jgi:putative endopeptidase
MNRLLKGVALATVLALTLGMSALAETNSHGLDRANMDTSYSPCENFYMYANGNWLKTNPIPAAYSSWSVWNEIYDRNSDILKKILEESSADPNLKPGSVRQKVGDFYYTAMDTTTIDKLGASPLDADLKMIDAIKTPQDLEKLIAHYHELGIGVVFDIGAEQDMKNSEQTIAYATQGGLGLPDRDYYTKTDSESQKIREEYVDHIAKMLQLLGESEMKSKSDAQQIMSIETKLAEASLTNVELRDPNSYYNVMTVKDADAKTPHFSWTTYFQDIGLPQITSFSYAHPKFFNTMDSLIANMPVEDWKPYMRWHILDNAAPNLSSPFVNEDFAFGGTILTGAKELRPRWKRVLSKENRYLGEALGQLFVQKAFSPEAKAKALDLVNHLRASLKVRLTNLTWMSDSTKQKALDKFNALNEKIGYPDKWRDYSKLDIDRKSFFGNIRRAVEFETRRNFNKIGKPVDRTEWGMNPQTVNAYYNPLMNEVVFPAAILQPPFFDPKADDAVNYGSIGCVIGHELTHGYDDEGRQFDAKGNLENWWTDADKKKFESHTERLVKQFDSYVAVDSMHINGQLTLGENIADLGGVTISYYALESVLGDGPRTKIDGFTPEQRFFLAWAQTWRTNQRPQEMKLQINTDPHSPSMFRVNGPLSDLKEFQKAFNCSSGDAMVRADSSRVVIW